MDSSMGTRHFLINDWLTKMNYGAGTIQAPKSIAKTEENVYETSVEPVEVEHKSRRQQVITAHWVDD